MKILKSILLVIVTLFATSYADAGLFNWRAYTEVGISQLNVSNDNMATGHPAQLRLIAGIDSPCQSGIEYFLCRHEAIEAMLSTTLQQGGANYLKNQDANQNTNTSATTLGLYFKPAWEITPQLQAYGRLGIAYNNVKTYETQNNISPSYGYGFEFYFSRSIGANVDYMQYSNKNNARVNGITTSLSYSFF
jgi:opacity protein-like surface antigen